MNYLSVQGWPSEGAVKDVKKPKSASVGFLLTQVGAHANLVFAERLTRLTPTLTPAHAGTLWAIADDEGVSQQALASRLGSHPSRLVALVDDLEREELVERRANPADRRSHAVYLTGRGKEALRAVTRIAREQQRDLCAALSDKEQDLLADLLGRIAAQQDLPQGVHPGFRTMR
jgi:DNA-binding MarR family transcriptional regulator